MATLTGTRFSDGHSLRDPSGLTWRYDSYDRVFRASRHGQNHVIMEGTGHCEGRWVVVTDGIQHEGSHVSLEQARASVNGGGGHDLHRQLDDLRAERARALTAERRANESLTSGQRALNTRRREVEQAERTLRTRRAAASTATDTRADLDRQISALDRQINGGW